MDLTNVINSQGRHLSSRNLPKRKNTEIGPVKLQDFVGQSKVDAAIQGETFFLMVGNTHEDVDQPFSVFARELRQKPATTRDALLQDWGHPDTHHQAIRLQALHACPKGSDNPPN
ncbi:uncharacterized protein LOC124125189 [Haliotis rufescens]|uniref:uncharacterized protein LOC124125189 n=1 Tax=Haliotis rufescens TaxID=6454 RepID=UPI00201EE785|nr:uncharacterized protein LOC124125189 [Haliotis rufescens]